MKKIVKNIIFLVAILSLSFGCLKSSENFYVVNSPNSLAKNLLISNRRGLLMEEDEDIELKILEDEKTKEKVLIKAATTELIPPAGGFWKWEPSEVTMNSKYRYYDFNTFEEYELDDKYRVDSIFNGYAIIPTFVLNNNKKERLIEQLIEDGSAYTKPIDYFESYEDNYFKSYDKVYNLKKMAFKDLGKTLTSIEIKNNEVIGIYTDDHYQNTYYHFDNDFNFIKELSLVEYEKITKDKNYLYDRIVTKFMTEDLSLCKIVKEEGFSFIVDSEDKQISEKHNCKYLYIANWMWKSSEPSIEDLIFRYDENDYYVYFNLKKAEDGAYKENIIYKGNENGIVIGRSNCYAIIDENKASIYSSRTDNLFGVVDYIVKNNKNEEMYLKELTLLENFAYGKYVYKEDLDKFISEIKEYLPFSILGKDFSYRYLTLNEMSSVMVLTGRYSVIKDRESLRTYLLDNTTLSLTEFDENIYSIDKIEMGDKVFYEFYKDSSRRYYDLYDEDFHKIDTDITYNSCNDNYMYYQKNNKIYVIDKYGKNVLSINSNRSETLFFSNNKIISTIIEDGKKIKTIVYDLLRDEEKEVPLIGKYLRYIGRDFFCYKSEDDKLIVLDQNADVIKTFEAGYNGIMGPNRENKNYFFLTIDIDDKVKIILNDKFEKIDDVDYSFPTIEYKECYSYVNDGTFYVRDSDNKIIYKEGIERLKKHSNSIEPINLYGGNPFNINNYDDVIKLLKKEYFEYVNREYDTGWSNLLAYIDKCYYSIFDIDNNGVDEIILYTHKEKGVILYMFTMYNDKPFCLINSVGDHEIGYYTNYTLIGDSIICEYVHGNIDSDEKSYYYMKNNKLVLIDKIFEGYVRDDKDNMEYKIIYIKDGAEREIGYDERDNIFKYYNTITANERKVLECSLDINSDYSVNIQ